MIAIEKHRELWTETMRARRTAVIKKKTKTKTKKKKQNKQQEQKYIERFKFLKNF